MRPISFGCALRPIFLVRVCCVCAPFAVVGHPAAMRDSGRPYQQFMADFAQPSTDADGNLVPSEDALEKFAAEVRARCVARRSRALAC